MPYKNKEDRRKHEAIPEIRAHINANRRKHYHKDVEKSREYSRMRGKLRTTEDRQREYQQRKAAGKIKKVPYIHGHTLRRHRVTVEWYEATLAAQAGGCAICGELPTRKKLAVDHNHTTGVNRGLLCDICNTALERMETVENWHDKAIAYLVKYEIAQREKEFK